MKTAPVLLCDFNWKEYVNSQLESMLIALPILLKTPSEGANSAEIQVVVRVVNIF